MKANDGLNIHADRLFDPGFVVGTAGCGIQIWICVPSNLVKVKKAGTTDPGEPFSPTVFQRVCTMN
jgi:hypothetical protein